MTKEQTLVESYSHVRKHEIPVEYQKSQGINLTKKASLLRTILWMLSMVLLTNVVMATLFYILYRYKIIQ